MATRAIRRTVHTQRLLLVWHSRTGMARQMADALEEGAAAVGNEMDEELHISRIAAADATVEDVLAANGYLFCAPENLATASGQMLEFFHRCYYPVFAPSQIGDTYDERSRLLGRPYGLAIAAGSDGEAAARQIARICQGWRLRAVRDPLVIRNGLSQTAANILRPKVLMDCAPDSREKCVELGGLVAATLLLQGAG